MFTLTQYDVGNPGPGLGQTQVEPRTGQIIGYEIGMCCFINKYKALRSKSPTKRVGLVQDGKLYRFFEFNVLSI
jgi:hypothetical protein